MQTHAIGDMEGIAERQRSNFCWHIIGEYPPQPGGVSDYTHLVARGLAQEGDQVHVWCAPSPGGAEPEEHGVTVHRELGNYSWADLVRVGKRLDQFPGPRRVLVQWVPHAYGQRSMNVGFCRWLNKRTAAGDRVEVMVHEAYLPFGRNWRQAGAALVHRLMTILVLRAAERVWISIPEWGRKLKPYAFGRDLSFQCLPIPNNIPVVCSEGAAEALRNRYASPQETLIGHFGTHGWPITQLLEPILNLLSGRNVQIVLMGIGSLEFREALVGRNPKLSAMVHATGPLSAEDLSSHIAACDILIQPYPDGVSSRRTSAMVGLAHGKPVVTTQGVLTAGFWAETGALAMAPAGDAAAFVELVGQLRESAVERQRMGRAAKKLYEERFDVSYTIRALRQRDQQMAEAS